MSLLAGCLFSMICLAMKLGNEDDARVAVSLVRLISASLANHHNGCQMGSRLF